MGWSQNIIGWLGLNAAMPDKGKIEVAVSQGDDYIPPASNDPDWVRAKAHIRERLVSLRRQIETPRLSHGETEGLRTAIIELEGVLNFQKPSKMFQSSSE